MKNKGRIIMGCFAASGIIFGTLFSASLPRGEGASAFGPLNAVRAVRTADISATQQTGEYGEEYEGGGDTEPGPVEEKILEITSPKEKTLTVTKSPLTFTGTCDPAEILTVNGQTVTPDENGKFTYKATLAKGKNIFTFSHKGDSVTYNVTYNFILAKKVTPSGDKTYAAGAVVPVSMVARSGSTVKATFGKKTVTLAADKSTESGGFVTYKGKFAMPTGGSKAKSAGKIVFKATLGKETKTLASGVITCKKTGKIVNSDKKATPSGGKYMNVGSGYVAEVVCANAETFTGKAGKGSSIDWSLPTNNYLPKGTVDYCKTSLISFKGKTTVKKYATLRAGYRLYTDKLNTPNPKVKVLKRYAGTLPDHNEIGVLSYKKSGSHMVLKLDCLWKAPFYFKLAPQSYYNTKTQDYRVKELTCDHIDITFCYATAFKNKDGKLPFTVAKDDPIFKSVKLIRGKSDCTLRLYLKKKGGFYGWDASYNANGELCFDFLIPRKIKKAGNDYGVNLNGAVILLDVGHGGKDGGAPGRSPKKHNEAAQNLLLANKIRKELNKIGAKVVMTRTRNTTCSSDQKQQIIRKVKPDYCLAIHHDSSTSSSRNGFCAYYFQPISKSATAYVQKETAKAGKSIYRNVEGPKWHTYYMLRCTTCPVVLTENGFISGSYDFQNIVSGAKNTLKAKAITRGIADYFKSIQ